MKLTTLTLALSGAALLVGASGAQANMVLKGTIAPPACTMVFAGAVTYEPLRPSDLSATAFTKLPAKDLQISVTCPGPAGMTFKLDDNRTASRLTGVPAFIDAAYTDDLNFGLGAVDGKKVGGYVVKVEHIRDADSTTNDKLLESDDGTAWSDSGKTSALPLKSGSYYSSQTAGESLNSPVFRDKHQVSLTVTTVINKTADLPTEQAFNLDGSATLIMNYL